LIVRRDSGAPESTTPCSTCCIFHSIVSSIPSINSLHQIIPSIRPSIDAAVGKLQYATGTKGELDEVIVGIDAFARRQHGVS
jgi:hypothetical protein